MDEKKDPYKKLQEEYLEVVDALPAISSYSDLLDYVNKNGEITLTHRARTEEKTFDETWIKELSDGFTHIDAIIARPRTFIEEKREVVLAALAKRVSSASVTHLASHSQYIHGFDEEGNVVPEKILSIDSDENYQIYENRFVMTLIMKLSAFVANRYHYIKSHGEIRNSNVLLAHTTFELDGVRYEIDDRVKLSLPAESGEKKEANERLLRQIEILEQRVEFYLSCPFMEKMKGAKPVHNPIAMTNLLEKNPDYHAALKLWRFVDSYTKLGIDYFFTERNVAFSDQEQKEAMAMLLGGGLTLKAQEADPLLIPKRRGDKDVKLSPKTLLSLEDITFQNDKFLYTQFPEIKASYEKLLEEKKPNPGEEKMAPTPDQAKAIEANHKEERLQEVITARDIKIDQDKWREKAALAEDNLAIAQNQKFSAFLASEIQRLDEIEARDKELREQEEKELAERRMAEHLAYEASLLEEQRKQVKEEALRDRALEDRAFLGHASPVPPTPVEAPKENPISSLFVFPSKQTGPATIKVGPESSTLKGISLPEGYSLVDASGKPIEPTALPDDLASLIAWAVSLSKQANDQVKTGEDLKEENVIEETPEGKTYQFPLKEKKK